jgi:Synergist-CTERM protein sorting domain-containing protein
MKKFAFVLSLLFILPFLLISGSMASAASFVPGEALVLLEGGFSEAVRAEKGAFEAALASRASAFARSVGAEAVGTYAAFSATTGQTIVHLRSVGKSTEELLAALENNPAVLSARPNYIRHRSAVPNDPRYGELWGMERIGAPAAWDSTTGSDSVYVAVIDSGITYDHPDLGANMGRDLDGNRGKNCLDGTPDPTDIMDDEDGHGTHVSGSIGAVGDNGVGVAGVNWSVKLLSGKVFDGNDGGSDAEIIEALNYALDQKNRGLNVRAVNMSLGGWNPPFVNPEADPLGAVIKAVCDAGVLVVVSAGNEYQDIDNPGGPGSDPENPDYDYRGERPYPACFQFDGMITVAAIDDSGARGDFSNYSPTFVHLAAPGVHILSTTSDGGYASWDGTSMAAPYVTGAAALLAARYPTETAAQIKARILGAVNVNTELAGKVATGGDLNVAAAMGGAPTGTPTASPTPRPGGGGGGGCSTGVVPGMLFLLVPLFLFNRR